MSPIAKACTYPGCGRIVFPPFIPKKGLRCDLHTNPAGPTSSTYAWKKLRGQVMARDEFRCLQCGSTEGLTVHLDPELRGRDDMATEADCLTLRRPCHGRLDQPRSG